MTLILTLLLALAHDARCELVLADQCDVIELNHFYDDNGRHVFDQVIFYNWDGRRHEVLDWRLVKEPSYLPQRLPGGACRCLFVDAQAIRQVTGSSGRETWTQFDPELAEREFLPKERRRLLRPRPLPPSP